ncbi:hypothetical protein NXX35_03365 [Bacteroides xylanisolvens]|nr:hypothetical protein NXX35_03365 [Bacteroides xylanisolvens]
MKITNDILKDYFYDKCSHEEEIEIQKWLTENDNDQVDQRFREIISEIQIEDRELSQKAFLKFQEATRPNRPAPYNPNSGVPFAGHNGWQPSFSSHFCF